MKLLNQYREGLKRTGRDVSPFTEGDIFEVMSNQRRRYTLHYLKQIDGEVATLRELAEQVAEWEYNKPRWELTADERKSVKNALHQFHLPKMEGYNTVEYDSQRGLITLTDAADNLEIYVEVVSKKDIPWGPYYLLFTLLYAPFVIGRWVGVEPLAQIPWAAFAIFLLVAIAMSALIHSYYSHSRMRLGTSTSDLEELTDDD